MKSNAKLVFIDIDGTLVSPPTAWHFFRHCLRHNIIPRSAIFYAGIHSIRNYFNQLNHTKTVEYWLGLLDGMPVKTLEQYCEIVFKERIQFQFIPTMLEKIRQHKANGDHIVLISSTIQHFAAIIADSLAVDYYYGLNVILDNNTITNQFIQPPPYHQGKIHYAKQRAEITQLDLAQAYFYTDSISDLPLLNVVGHPVTINPDRHLKKIAKQQGWPILEDQRRVDLYTFINKQ